MYHSTGQYFCIERPVFYQLIIIVIFTFPKTNFKLVVVALLSFGMIS